MNAAAMRTDEARLLRFGFSCGDCLNRQTQFDAVTQRYVGRMHETEIAYLVKPLRRNMLEKSPYKLLACQLYRSIVTKKGDVGVGYLYDPIIGYSDSVDVAR